MRMNGRVAQLVEQRIENPRAEGSSPPPTTTNSEPVFGRAFFIVRRLSVREGRFLIACLFKLWLTRPGVHFRGDCHVCIVLRAFRLLTARHPVVDHRRRSLSSLLLACRQETPSYRRLRFCELTVGTIIQCLVFRALEVCAKGPVRTLMTASRIGRRKKEE